jgi:hypothetical protein
MSDIDFAKAIRAKRRKKVQKFMSGGTAGGDGGGSSSGGDSGGGDSGGSTGGGYSAGPSQAAAFGVSGLTAGQGSDAAGMDGGSGSSNAAATEAAQTAQMAEAARNAEGARATAAAQTAYADALARGEAYARNANIAKSIASFVPVIGQLAAKGIDAATETPAAYAQKAADAAYFGTPVSQGSVSNTSTPGGGTATPTAQPVADPVVEAAENLRGDAAAQNAATISKIVGKIAPWQTPTYARGGKVQKFADGGTATGTGTGTTTTATTDPRLNQFVAQQAQLDEVAGYGSAVEQGVGGYKTAEQQAAQSGASQKALAGQLAQQALGQGPNPALEQLKQTTGQNIQQATGMIASQKGINPALAARVAALAGANANQTAAGQAATQAAQQQINAQQLQAQTLSSQRAQDIAQQQNALSLYGTSGQLLQGQNAQRIQALAGSQNLNQLTSSQNAQIGLGYEQIASQNQLAQDAANRQLVGSIINAAGGVASSLARGGQVDFRTGGHVPGQARVAGDDERNDTVDAKLSPGEIVIPRTVAQAPNAPDEAAEFVAALKGRKQKALPAGGYGRVLAKQREIEQRLAELERMSDGGEVESDDVDDPERESPGLFAAIKNWFTSSGSQPESRKAADAINAAMPEGLSARNAVMAQRRKMALLDEIDRAGRR